MDLPKTEQELQDLIDAKVKEKEDELTSKHNGEMATMRQKHTAELQKAKDQANLSAEELAQTKIKEQQEADQKELNDLRAFKKSATISQRLAKENLPDYLKNDSRLINASDDEFEKALKSVKSDYEGSLPKGNTHSSVVQTSTGTPANGGTKEEAFEKMGEALKELVK